MFWRIVNIAMPIVVASYDVAFINAAPDAAIFVQVTAGFVFCGCIVWLSAGLAYGLE